MGRSHSKHEDVAPAPHMHRNAENSKTKDPKALTAQDPSHAHANAQPSTSRAVKKTLSPGTSEESTKGQHAQSHPRIQTSSFDKLGKKKRLIPKIVVTGPSEEVLLSSLSDVLPETKTIRDTEDYGPYNVHTRPSTVDAYRDLDKEL